jgi:hypothetical protein
MLSRKLIPLTALLIIFTAACSLAPAASPVVTDVPPQVTLPPVVPVTGFTETPTTEVATVETLPTVTTDLRVVITAATGSLSIRRGPGTAYNLLGYLMDTQSAVATARDPSSNWLYIPIPAAPTYFGWVSAATSYSTVAGDIASLPVMNVAAAEPITIRNCTYHPMKITPLNIILQPQTDPIHSTVVLPGDYAAYDQSVSNTLVKSMSLEEGDWVDINTDGLGNTYYCP